MPGNLASSSPSLPIVVRDRDGMGLPFSRGLLATSILATGLEAAEAYAIVADVQRQLEDRGCDEVDGDTLVDLTAATIAASAGDAAARRYRSWREARHAGRPIIVALGGAPGVGKSTIASRLAVRLGITRTVTTDTIREVLRTVIPESVLPELHASTFETTALDQLGEPALGSFLRQARSVTGATVAVAARYADEQRSVVIEGVHVLPGFLSRELGRSSANPIVVEQLLILGDEPQHRGHLSARASVEPGRRGQRHLDHLDTIRAIQATLVELAVEAGVERYDIGSPDDLTQVIVDEIVAAI